jgi:hypothetical protein
MYFDFWIFIEAFCISWVLVIGLEGGIRYFRGFIRKDILERFFIDWYYSLPSHPKIRHAYDFLMTWIIPVTLSIAFGVWYYSERIGYLYIE